MSVGASNTKRTRIDCQANSGLEIRFLPGRGKKGIFKSAAYSAFDGPVSLNAQHISGAR